jgi:hypothetical protein
MNLIQSNNPTMSSREIAELTEKEHKNVKRDISAMLEALELDVSCFLYYYYDSQNRKKDEYKLNLHLASTLIAGYSPRARLAIISKMEERALLDAINEFETPDDLPDMYVYAIKESETGRIKLGISKDPEERLKQLQTGNSQKLELVAYRKAENRYKDESATHLANAACRVRGEWFAPSRNEASSILGN